MHTDTRWEANHANVIFLSNERQPLVLEIGDRRYLVVYTPTPEDKGLYDEVRDFLANDGAAKFFHFLLQYPLGDFHEHTKPPMTEAKEELIGLSHEAGRALHDASGSVGSSTSHAGVFGRAAVPGLPTMVRQQRRALATAAQAGFTMEAKRWAIERIERDEKGHQAGAVPGLQGRDAAGRDRGGRRASPSGRSCRAAQGRRRASPRAPGSRSRRRLRAAPGPLPAPPRCRRRRRPRPPRRARKGRVMRNLMPRCYARYVPVSLGTRVVTCVTPVSRVSHVCAHTSRVSACVRVRVTHPP
jgi:hypothetical protein